ncbi:MAG: rRNA pseudouridine synthase [Lachnospiraceae bacterium]|nr:rRNA pseudouridine synthase [Lachnospiraceae bacterium]
MRLDRFLCELNIGTRSQVKEYIRQGIVSVNGQIVKAPDCKIAEETDRIVFKGEELFYRQFVYYMLNKPKGVVSATKDNTADTVLGLLDAPTGKNLFPVGRLDKDTEGLLLITNDGALSHRLLSPKNHVDKTYLAEIRAPLSCEDIQALETGVDIGDDKLTAPAKVKVLSDRQITLTIHEGRFHQVKRMLQAVDNEVLSLKRIRFGPLFLDESLAPGESRLLTTQEVALLHES